MKALQFDFHPLRYGATLLLGRLSRAAYWGPLSCLRYRDVPEPPLPGDDWVRVRTWYAGICGSDLNLILLRESPSLSPYSSFPFTLGHENVGVVEETGPAVSDLRVGQRVVVDPPLTCAPRGFTEPCPACARGDPHCHRYHEGRLAPGIQIGACRDTGGSWSPCFVAHRSQVFPVPDGVSDEDAVLAEPFACALHAVSLAPPAPGDRVLVVGGGVIGLCTVAALRALGYPCRIVALVRHSFQAEAARVLGADTVVQARGSRRYRAVADALGARLLKPVLGPPVLAGGAPVVFECVGTGPAVDDALRFAAPGGRVVLVGLSAFPRGVDWTPIWFKELHVRGSFVTGSVDLPSGRRVRSLPLALELMRAGKARLGELVTHKFALEEYRTALATLLNRRHTGVIKAVFDFTR